MVPVVKCRLVCKATAHVYLFSRVLYLKNDNWSLVVVLIAFNPSTSEAEAGGSFVSFEASFVQQQQTYNQKQKVGSEACASVASALSVSRVFLRARILGGSKSEWPVF